MATSADGSSRLPEAQICEINGVSQQYRQTLVRRELARPAAPGGCTIRDALELAAIKALRDALASRDAPLAAKQLAGLLSGAVPGERLDVVFDRRYKRLCVARSDAELRGLVIHARPVTVIPLAERMAAVGDAFRRLAEARGPSSQGGASNRRRGRAASRGGGDR